MSDASLHCFQALLLITDHRLVMPGLKVKNLKFDNNKYIACLLDKLDVQAHLETIKIPQPIGIREKRNQLLQELL